MPKYAKIYQTVPKIWQNYARTMPKTCRNCDKLCQNYVKNRPTLGQSYAKTSQKDFWKIYAKICTLKKGKNTPKIRQHVCKTMPKLCQNLQLYGYFV